MGTTTSVPSGKPTILFLLCTVETAHTVIVQSLHRSKLTLVPLLPNIRIAKWPLQGTTDVTLRSIIASYIPQPCTPLVHYCHSVTIIQRMHFRLKLVRNGGHSLWYRRSCITCSIKVHPHARSKKFPSVFIMATVVYTNNPAEICRVICRNSFRGVESR